MSAAAGTGSEMIAHVVLLRPKPTLSSTARAAFVSAFERAVQEIPTVRGVRVGRRVTHGAAYEQVAGDATFLAVIDFDDVEGLKAYLLHPAHAELGRLFGEVLQTAQVFDFSVGGIEQLHLIAQGR